MTLTLKLTPQEEAALTEKAAKSGLDPISYIKQLITEPDDDDISLAESLKGYIGVIDGTPGPGDGRAWSEIDAACDPL